jgi:adenosylcobinamide kinase/adenosylcobinamide-phosphate guanylyltransferase
MVNRVGRHQQARSPGWETAEVPIDLVDWFLAKGESYHAVVLDCMTLWLSNLQGRGVSEVDILGRVTTLLEVIRSSRARVIVVSNELGMGLVPAEASARSFRDLAGQVNQRIACRADEVYLVVAGIPISLKER